VGDPDLTSGVTLLSELSSEELVDLSLENSVGWRGEREKEKGGNEVSFFFCFPSLSKGSISRSNTDRRVYSPTNFLFLET